MRRISVRDIRNRGGRVLQRVARGETLTVTLDGRPVAELRPLPRQPYASAALLERWRGLPRVRARALRRDLDRAVDPSL
jgi:prevent-host-death family protein